MGKWLIAVGAALVIIGVLLNAYPNLFGWFGRLPGDVRIASERGRVFIPLTSMLIISLLLSLLLSLWRR